MRWTFAIILMTIGQTIISAQDNFHFEVSGISTDLIRTKHSSFEDDPNSSKTSMRFGLSHEVELNKRIVLNSILTYEWRRPVEVYWFAFSVANGVPANLYFTNYPTTPSNNRFQYLEYPEIFPDFHFVGITFLPSYKLSLSTPFKVGIGPYFRYLLNQENLMFNKNNFRDMSIFFGEPFNYPDQTQVYHQWDIGFTFRSEIELKFLKVTENRLVLFGQVDQSIIPLHQQTNLGNKFLWNVISFGFGYKFQ